MAILKSVLGKFTQSMGDVTFSTWKGKNVAKEKATNVANPKTPAQIKQRAAMSFMVALSRPILVQLRLYWSKQAVKMSQYNAFVKENLSKLLYVTDHWEFPLTGFLLTKGTLFGFGSISAVASEAASDVDITLAEAPNAKGYGANVKIFSAAFDKLGNLVSDFTDNGLASSLSTTTVTVANLTAVENDDIQVFIFAYDTYSRNASDSSTIRVTVGA